MRAFTRIAVAVLLTTVLAGTMLAQTTAQTPPPSTRGPHVSQRGLERMAQQLNLTDAQQTQIKGLFQTQRQQAQSIRQDTSLTPEQKQDKLKQLRESTHQQVLAVLTPEQQQQMTQMRGHHQGMGGGMGPLAGLNLTADQKSKIQPIMQSSRQQLQAVRIDGSLTPEQKQGKVREIRQNTMSQVNAVLTPEQQQQLKQKRNRPGPGGKHAPPSAPQS